MSREIYVKPCASCGEPAPGNPYCQKCLDDPQRSLHYQQLQHEPMSSTEFQQFHDCGKMPERFWPTEIAKLSEEYATDVISLQVFEDSLDDLIGLNAQPRAGRGKATSLEELTVEELEIDLALKSNTNEDCTEVMQELVRRKYEETGGLRE